MKLAAKLTGVTILAILVVFGVRGYQGARREIASAEVDAREAQVLIGRALRPALVEVWQKDGRERALDVLFYARERMRLLRPLDLRLIPAPETQPPRAEPLAAREIFARIAEREDLTLTTSRAGTETLVTYLPVRVSGRLLGALEISAPLTAGKDKFEAEVLRTIQRTVIAAAFAIISVVAVGLVFVGRPMRRLVEKARRIGAGDLEGPLRTTSNDEIGELSREINDMCERLKAAQRRVTEETEQRIAASDQLRHADRLTTVGKLASGLAHELGTPLNVVSGRAKMILRGRVTGGDVAESAAVIVEQSERMTGIIKQLLGFARRRRPQRRRENMQRIAAAALTLLRPMADKARVSFVGPEGTPEVLADVDAALLAQVITNLVVNAIQAMPEGGVARIQVAHESVVPPADVGGGEGPHVCLHVEDTGVGIAPEHLDRVFEPFFTTKDVNQGTGLGLSVAYGIVREHGGWIKASSEPRRGSRFSIYLPAFAIAQEGPVDDTNSARR